MSIISKLPKIFKTKWDKRAQELRSGKCKYGICHICQGSVELNENGLLYECHTCGNITSIDERISNEVIRGYFSGTI